VKKALVKSTPRIIEGGYGKRSKIWARFLVGGNSDTVGLNTASLDHTARSRNLAVALTCQRKRMEQQS